MSTRLEKVELQADVYMTCLQHALSTENFEVMGLLIGNIHDDGIAKISSVVILRRLDKQKDRVEISDDQLLSAAAHAEVLSKELGEQVRVIGWYHSHPHITVFPSHVDIRTQATYQTMDPCFVGLIFSVFTEEKETKEQEVLLTCFQSRDNATVEIPLEIMHTMEIGKSCLDTMKDLPKILVQEEEETSSAFASDADLLAVIHNAAVRTRALVHITEITVKPLVQIFYERESSCALRLKQLENEKIMLENMLRGLEESDKQKSVEY